MLPITASPERWWAWLLAVLLLTAWPAAAQPPLRVELEAPDSVRALLQRHLRILRGDVSVPEAAVDRNAMVRRARREAADLLATEGYFSPEINLRRRADQPWRLTVEPGPRARISAVSIEFAGALAADGEAHAARREALRAQWGLAVGQPFRQAAWDGAKAALLDTLGARDYAAARLLSSRAEVDPQAATVVLSVEVDSGPPFFLGEVHGSGLSRLPEDLISRYSTLRIGEPYDRERLLAFQSALQAAPQFGSVTVSIDPDPALAAAVPVQVEVSEAQSRQLGFGTGYSTNTGYRVEFNYRDVNLRQRAWELSTGVRLEQRRRSAYADIFLPPEAAGQRYSFGVLAEHTDVQGLRLGTQAVGGALTRSRGNIETQIALRLQQERRHPEGGERSSASTLTANWTWVQRAVDDLLDPRRGHVLEFQLGGGTRLALAGQDFVRLYGRAVHYQPVGSRDVLILRGELGATLAPERKGVPQDFLFRTGGAQSVRGYAYQSLGVSEGEAVVGGRYLAVASAEYVHWFLPQWGVATFVDAGDANDDRRAFDLKLGYGVGARWASPAGPLALDLAWGRETRSLRLHFGIAIAF